MALWDGRFEGSPAKEMEEFGESLSVDLQMANEDIQGSLAHSKMLAEVGIISHKEYCSIVNGLREIQKELSEGWVPNIADEDIHMAIEFKLRLKIGEAAGKLHTGRSRNDQVAVDVRLWLRDKIKLLKVKLKKLIFSLIDKAASEGKVLVPSYTHLQQAQPIWFSHQLLCHAWSFFRDIERADDLLKRVNRNPLGAAALAGTPHPINRELTTEYLNFDGIIENAMDAVSSRDHLQEAASVLAILASNLSRLASELILWSTKEFSRIRLSDDWSTGSSIMPQKRNPDAAELIRGKTGRVYGSLFSLLTLTKGLPMAYNRDLQEDRHALFDAVQSSISSVGVMNGCISSMRILTPPSLDGNLLLATEIADYLVCKGVPFREAHHTTGRIIKKCEKEKIGLNKLKLRQYKKFNSLFKKDIYEWLDPKSAVERRTSRGGTAWSEIERQIKLLKELI